MAAELSVVKRVERLVEISPSGFAMAFHVSFTRPAFLIQNYPPEWSSIYSAKGYVMVDPTVKWGFENTGNIRWSDLKADDEEGVLAEAGDHGLCFGLTHVLEKGGSRTMSSFARKDREFEPEETAEIAEHVDAIHAATQQAQALTQEDYTALKEVVVTVTSS